MSEEFNDFQLVSDEPEVAVQEPENQDPEQTKENTKPEELNDKSFDELASGKKPEPKKEPEKEPKKKVENKPEEPEKEKKQSRLNKRFKGFKDRIVEKESEIESLKKQLSDMQQKYGIVDKDGMPVRPNPGWFRDEKSYRKAMQGWYETTAKIKAEKETEQRLNFERSAQKFQENVEKERLKWKDWNDTVNDDLLQYPAKDYVLEGIMNLENSADVMYYMGKNPDEYIGLNQMPEKQALIKLGSISSQMDAFVSQNKTKNKVSKATKVIKKVDDTKKIETPDPLEDDAAFDRLYK